MALPRLIPRRELFADPVRSGATIAPDGSKLAWLEPYEGKTNVWVRSRDADDLRPVTFDTVRPVHHYGWSRDSTRILYHQDAGGDENWHLFSVDLATMATVDLTPSVGARSTLAKLPRNLPDDAFVRSNERDRAVMDLWRIDLRSAERTLVAPNDHRISSWVIDDDGRVLAATAHADGVGTDVLVPDGDGWRTIASYGPRDVGILGPAPDGRLWARTRSHDRDLAGLVLLDLETGREELVETDPKGEVDLRGAILREGTRELAATVYVSERHRYEVRDPFIGSLLDRARELDAGDPVLRGRTTDERTWIVSFVSDVNPAASWLIDAQTGETEFLFRTRPWLHADELAYMHPHTVRSRDGLDLRSYLTLPRGVEPARLPLVVYVHGGPWSRDGWGFSSPVQFFANRGYAVLQVNYRGSTGFGRAFTDAAVGQFGRAMQDDLLDAVEWAVGEGYADPARIAIHGGSYGGYATLAAITFTPDVFAAAISFVGPSSLVTLIRSFPPYWRQLLDNSWFRFVGDPDDPAVEAALREVSPLDFVDRIRTPLLVVQGANDPRVTKAEADQLVRALRDRGVDVGYLLAPDEGHGFKDTLNRMAAYRAMELFLAEHLGGRAETSDDREVEERLAVLTVDPATV